MTIAVLEALTFGLGRLVSAADAAGQRLRLLTGDRSVYRHELRQLPARALDIVDVDTRDGPACAAALDATPDLAGLINTTDTWLLPGAELAARFGLPGPDPTTVRLLRDKCRTRVRLHEQGLSRGGAIEVPTGPDAAGTVLRAVGLPVVLKDSAGTGSRNVWLAHDSRRLTEALTEATGRELAGRLLAEPYLPGPLYSAETLSWNGHTRLLGVTGRLLSTRWFGREELGSFPVRFPAADAVAIGQWVARVLAAVGHTQGFGHVEFVLTTDGPEVVEINARIGGGLIGEAMCRVLRTNLYTALVDMALGRPPALLETLPEPPGYTDASAMVLVYPEQVGTFTGTTGVEALTNRPGTPQWFPAMRVGRHVEDLRDQRACVGLVLADGNSTEIAIYNAVSAASAVRAVMR